MVLDRADLLLDPRWQTAGSTNSNSAWIVDELTQAFQAQTTKYWCDALEQTGVRYAPVNHYADVVKDTGVRMNGYIQDVPALQGESPLAVLPPLRLNGESLEPADHVPALGEHTNEVLKQLGLTQEEITNLRSEGIV